MVLGALKGTHQSRRDDVMPVAIGDVDPGGPFVHVFDKGALDFVLQEMDTTSEFPRYLREREKFIREERLGHSSGEAEKLATYLQHGDANGDHVELFAVRGTANQRRSSLATASRTS